MQAVAEADDRYRFLVPSPFQCALLGRLVLC
jgi:hypothetical protein